MKLALDSARPLIKPGNQNRLDIGDAKSVQAIHTNAGYYGEGGRVGHVDFCINGGRRQPYCGNTTSELKIVSFSRLTSNADINFTVLYKMLIYAVTFGQFAIWHNPFLKGMILLPSPAIGNVHQQSI